MKRKSVFLQVFLIILVTSSFTALGVQRVEAEPGTIHIRANGSIDPPTTPISAADNVTYTFADNINGSIVVERDNIVIDGNSHTLEQAPSITGWGVGIDLSSRSNVTVTNTKIEGFLDGIFLSHSFNNNISGNTFIDDGLTLSYSSLNIVENNTVNGKPLVYLEGVANYTVSDAGQVILINCTGMRVENLNLSRTAVGILLWETRNSVITGNNINNYKCIWIVNSSNISISGNNIIGTYPTPSDGINLFYSSGNSICGNNITNNAYGIGLTDSPNNSVSENNITNNSRAGISVDASHYPASSDYNSIFGNNIAANHAGIDIYRSIDRFYHNDFVDNSHQVSYGRWTGPGSANSWDDGYPSGGNYWSDYNGTDANHDGIGDTAYVIDVNNTDNYPLMGMFSDFNATSDQHVTTICNSTISDFQFNGTAITFNVTVDEETSGFCRICVPTSLMSAAYIVLVNGTEVASNLLPCSTSTHSYLYFNYTHPTQEIIIKSESPLSLIPPLIIAATLIAVVTPIAIIIYRKKHR